MRSSLLSITASLTLFALPGCSSCQQEAEPEVPVAQASKDKAERRKRRKRNRTKQQAEKKQKERLERHPPVSMPPSAAALIAPSPLDTPVPKVPSVPALTSQPNVVVILGCTVRKDQLAPYGGLQEATPFLASMAANGVTFDDTIASAPWTRAASTAIITGFPPIAIGMVEPAEGRNNRRLPPAITTLAERMDEAGYYTVGGTANPNLLADFGFDQGFDAYQLNIASDWSKKTPGRQVLDVLLANVDKQRAKDPSTPIYLQAMLLDAHEPRAKDSTFESKDVHPRISTYRGHLHHFDEALAHLKASLEKRGMTDDNTLIVVIGDHGEGMYYPEHHGWAHGQYHTPSTNHVPWLMQGAGVASGHRVLGVSSQVDLVPTLIGLLGLEEDPSLPGMDFSQQVRGKSSLTGREAAYSDSWFQSVNRAAIYTSTTQCQLDFKDPTNFDPKGYFTPGCYDRHDDPTFTKPSQNEALLAKLHAWRAEHGQFVGGQSVEVVEVDEELNAQLEMLGYVE